jgi:hypothetical protein
MPIFLYVKTHNITGLKYFGKTTRNDPHKYRGSGVYWKRHIAKYGYDVTTEIVGVFNTEDDCTDFALEYSRRHDIVSSNLWANIREENGCDGAPKGHKGHKFTEEQLFHMSNLVKERWKNPDFKQHMKKAQQNSWSDTRKKEQSIRLKTEFWTEDQKKIHSEKIKGHPGSTKLKGVPKTAEHNKKNSEALKGKKKSEAHRLALSKPKIRVCRISDRKEMSINHFNRHSK